MALDLKHFMVLAGRWTSLLLAASTFACTVKALEGGAVYRQHCEGIWKAHPELITLCTDNHRFAAARYGYRRVYELALGGGDLNLGGCAEEALAAEKEGGVADWRNVEDCLLSRSQRWRLALIGAEGAVAVEAARYACGLKAPVAVDAFDECFYRRLTEADARVWSPMPPDVKESSWKVYRLCLSADKVVTGDDEDASLYSAFESLNSDLKRQFLETPRYEWSKRDHGAQCAFAAGQSKHHFLYFPKMELCYRWSVDERFSKVLEPKLLWSHLLSFYVCEARDHQSNDTCLIEQFKAMPPICALFLSIDKDENSKDKKLRAVHICEAAVRFDEFDLYEVPDPFGGFYDLPSFRYCMAEQTKLMGIPNPVAQQR